MPTANKASAKTGARPRKKSLPAARGHHPSAAPELPPTRPATTNPTSLPDGLGIEYDFEASVGYWMVLGSQAFQKALNEELTPHGITFRQCQVLGWLVLDGQLSQTELAGRMMIEPATLVGVLDRMQRNRWISRVSSADDRRRKLIQLDPAARDIWKKIISCARRVRARAVEGLTERQVAALIKSLQVVLGNLSPAPENGAKKSSPKASHDSPPLPPTPFKEVLPVNRRR